MPLDVMQQIDEEKRALAISGDNSELVGSLTEIQEKAEKSSEVLSVLNSIINSMTSSGRNLHDCIGDVVKDFEAYDRIASKSRKETSALTSEYALLGAAGVRGITSINASLTQSLSLLQTVEREVKKLDGALASIKAPNLNVPKVSSEPLPRYASGGQIQGRHRTGDRNLVRVNAGEWILNERQMENLRKQLGAHSQADVFRRAGGNPNYVRRDSYGVPMAVEGLRGRAINTQISQSRAGLENWYNAPRTYASTKPNIEAADVALEQLNKTLSNLSRQDYDRLNIDGRVEAIFNRLSSGTVTTSRALQSLTRQIEAVVNIVETDAEATRQLQLAADAVVNVDLSRFSGDALRFAENMERASNIARSSHATDQERANARIETNSNKVMLDLTQQRYLTRQQRAQRQDLINRFNSAGNTQDRAAVAQEAANLGNMDNIERKIGLRDSLSIGMEKLKDSKLESIKSFLGGTPVGLTAIAVAAGYAANEMIKFIDSVTNSLEAASKLSVENARLGKSFDSIFGQGSFEQFRDELGVTRKEMLELAPTIADAYRNAGVEMEHIQAVASNIVKEFGAMDPKILQEALDVMKELTSDQVKVLMTGQGTFQEKANMYANLSESGNSGRAADLLEQGIFGGDNLSANISDADREIIKNLQAMRRAEEDLSLMAKDAFGMVPFLSNTIPLAKYGQAIISFGATAFQIWTSLKVIESLSIGKTGSNAASGVPLGRALSRATPYLIGISAGISVAESIASGYSAEAAKSRERSKKKNEDKITSAKSFYDQTGIYSSDAESLIDYDKVKETANNYGKWGARIGGTAGAIGGAIGGGMAGSAIGAGAGTVVLPVVGTVSGAAVGTAVGAVAGGVTFGYLGAEAGGKIGYDIGYDKEMERQKENWENVFGEDFEKIWTTFEKTQRELQEIRKDVEEERKTQIKSLRFQASIEKVAKKLESGQYTRFNDRMVATSRLALDVMSISGGSSSQYGAQVSNILSNAAESYSTTMKVIGEQQKRVAEQEGIDEEARINKSRQLMELEAEATKKFVEAVYDSIGNYQQIPEVIKNTLKEKINSLTIEMSGRNMAGTSGMVSGLLGENLSMTLENQRVAFEQYEKEKPKLEEAQKRAREQYNNAVADFKKNSSNFGNLGLSRDIIDEKGNIKGDVLERNYGIIQERRKNLDARILKGQGWSEEESRIASDAISLMDSPLKNITELRSKINNTSEDDYDDEEGKKLQKQALDRLLEVQSAAEERAAGLKGTQLESSANADLQAIKSLVGRFEKENEEEMSRDQLLKFLQGLEGINATGNQMHQIRKRGMSMPGVEEESQALASAENAQNQIAKANDQSLAAMRNFEKQFTALMEMSKEVSDAALKVAAQIENDPTVVFFNKQKEYIDTYSEYLLGSNRASEHISSVIQNMTAKLKAEQLVVKNNAETLDKAQKENLASIEKKLNSEGSQAYKDVLNELLGFQKLKLAAATDPSKNEEVMNAQSHIDRLMAGVTDEKERKELNTILAVISQLFSAVTEIEKQQAKTDSQSFQNLKQIIGMMDVYKGQLNYISLTSRKERITSESQLARSRFDSGSVRALADEMRINAELTYQEDVKNIEAWFKSAMEGLDPNDKEYDKKVALLNDERRNRLATSENIRQEGFVNAAKQIYDYEAKRVDLARNQLDIQLDLAQTIGAPMETIVALERQRVQKAREAAQIAEEQYNMLLETSNDQEAIEEAKLKMQEAQAKVIKDSLGAQRSMMEKVFGNMIGAFSEVAGIMGPNNIAGKYGLGYTQGTDGTVRKSDGKPSGGYRDRVFGNFAAGGVALRDTSIPGGSNKPTANATGAASSPTQKPETTNAPRGATAKSKNMQGFDTLGETFKDTKEGIEIAVFWEKKIYNLLEENFRTMVTGKPVSSWTAAGDVPGGHYDNSLKIDATNIPVQGKMNPRNSTVEDVKAAQVDFSKMSPEELAKYQKAQGAKNTVIQRSLKGNKGIPTLEDETKPISPEVQKFIDQFNPMNILKKPDLFAGMATPEAKKIGPYKENAPLSEEAKKFINQFDPMKKLQNPFDSLMDSLPKPEEAPKSVFEMSPKQLEEWKKKQKQESEKPRETLIQKANRLTEDYKKASPEERRKMIEKYRAKLGNVDPSKLDPAEQTAFQNVSKLAKSAAPLSPMQMAMLNNPGMGSYPMYVPPMSDPTLSSDQFFNLVRDTTFLERRGKTKALPTPSAAETPASAGSKPESVSSGKESGTSGGGAQNINVEVQVKFNNQMFENQITKVTTSPSVARNIVASGMGKTE